MKPYGMELILDLHDCDPATFTRESLTQFFIELCALIGMVRADLHFWDYEDVPDEDRDEHSRQPHMDGISAVQFIETSNITIHTLIQLQAAYLNIFSCKEFDADLARQFTEAFFGGCAVQAQSIDRT